MKEFKAFLLLMASLCLSLVGFGVCFHLVVSRHWNGALMVLPALLWFLVVKRIFAMIALRIK